MSSGLTVFRLGVQATAHDDLVHGLICLRISIPRENDASHALRWNLFSSKPPRLVSPPSIHPLPIPLAYRSSSTPRTARPRALAIASTLLSLPVPSTYPPNRQTNSPHLDVSPKSGQVCVVLDPSGRKGKQHASPSAAGGKMEWVVIMEFETAVQEGSERGFDKVLLSLPKCLHSVIRFQVTPPSVGTSTDGEVSIMTEPKMLALPPSTFTAPPTPYPRASDTVVGFEDGWEDGEDLRDGQMSEGASEDDDGGSWLEGRFQATSQLRLEWSFASAAHATSLQVMPRWDPRHPAINIVYESDGQGSTTGDQLVPVEFVVPDGWGWKDLDIAGASLISWHSTDTVDFRVHLRDGDDEGDAEGPDDSFATIRTQRATHPKLSTHTSASLMKQTLPVAGDLKVDDFSFEMTSMDHLTIPASTGSGGSGSHQTRPATPARMSPGLGAVNSPIQTVNLDQPSAARCFDLIFASDADDRSFYIEGTLVPLSPLTLVSGSAPVEVPFIRAAGIPSSALTCPNSNLPEDAVHDTAQATIGTFRWTDMYGSPILPPPSEPIRGNVRVRLQRGQWGAISMSIVFPWPGRSPECAFTLALPGDAAPRVSKVDLGGAAVPRAVTSTGHGHEVRLGQGAAGRATGQMAEVTLELSDPGEEIPLPVFAEAEGKMTVELRGDGWSSVLPNLKTTLTRDPTSSTTFHTTLPSRDTPSVRIAHQPAASTNGRRTLFSLSTFFNIFMLWLVISLGQQVQRLRTEISFVAEEAKDLRMYGFDHPAQVPTVTVTADNAGPTILPDGVDLKELLDRLRHHTGDTGHENRPAADVERSLGRVVFGSSGWNKWSNSPTVRTFSRGVTRIWDVFVWLIRGP